jgi:hypothetical protein
MFKDDFKRMKLIKGGGWKCRCCGPRTEEHKKLYRRMCRRKLRQLDMREFKNG